MSIKIKKPSKHKQMVNNLIKHPDLIEKGVYLFYKEFGMGRGRVDLIGLDKEKNIVIVEVKTRKPDIKSREKQLRKYYGPWKYLFGKMGIKKMIRVFLYTPKGTKFLYNIKPFSGQYIGTRKGLPTSSEIYGGKINVEKT